MCLQASDASILFLSLEKKVKASTSSRSVAPAAISLLPDEKGERRGGAISERDNKVEKVLVLLSVVPGTLRMQTQPPPKVLRNMEAQLEHVHVAYTYFATFGADSHARSVIINKNFCAGDQEEVC